VAGNIRQLENTIERALALGRGRSQIDVSALPEEIQASGQPVARARWRCRCMASISTRTSRTSNAS